MDSQPVKNTKQRVKAEDENRKKRNNEENLAKVAATKLSYNGENDVSRETVERIPSYLDMSEKTRTKTPVFRSRSGTPSMNQRDNATKMRPVKIANSAQIRPKVNGGKARFKQRPSSSPHLERSKKATRSPALNRHFPIFKPDLKLSDDDDDECNGVDSVAKSHGTISSSISGSLSSSSKDCRESRKKTVKLNDEVTDDDKERLTPSSGVSRESLNEVTSNNPMDCVPRHACRSLGGLCGRTRGGSMRQLRSVTAQEFIDNSLRSLPGYRSLVALDVSDEDRRILELMATRRLTQAETERRACETRLAWEEDRGNTIYVKELKDEQRRVQLAEQRKHEAAENARRYALALENYQLYREQLISLLREKEERAQRLLQEIRQWKVDRLQERHQRWLSRQSELQAAKNELSDVEAHTRSLVLQKLEERLHLAEERKKALEEEQKQRLLLANQQEETRFSERRKQIEEKIESSLNELRETLKDKQEKGHQLHSSHASSRVQEMLLRRQKQHEKYARARQFLDGLQSGMDKWRQHVAEIQEAAAKRAQKVVAKQIAQRKKQLEEERNARKAAHQQKMEQLKAEEKDREKAMRELLSAKERRVTDLVSTRDRMIQQGRHVAQTTATIREHLKQELFLDTFDRRAARATMEARITLRNPVVRSPVNESTLVLG